MTATPTPSKIRASAPVPTTPRPPRSPGAYDVTLITPQASRAPALPVGWVW